MNKENENTKILTFFADMREEKKEKEFIIK